MFQKKFKKAKYANKEVYSILQQSVEQYRAEVDNYSDQVSLKILEEMSRQNKYHIKGTLNDEIGKLLANPPQLNDLSVPVFLSSTDQEGNHYQVVNLERGFLFIYLEKSCWIAQMHVERMNTYLDIKKSFKQELPAMIFNTSKQIAPVYELIRLAKLFV